jgi:hypothetical protein
MAVTWEERQAAMRRNQGLPDYSQGTYYGGAGLPKVSKEGQVAQGIGGGLMAAGAIPSPASPFLLGAGLALQAGGGIYNAYEESKDKKRANALEDEQWAITRRKLLQEMAEREKANQWKAGFARRLYMGGK